MTRRGISRWARPVLAALIGIVAALAAGCTGSEPQEGGAPTTGRTPPIILPPVFMRWEKEDPATERPDGRVLWVTPLFHHSSDGRGNTASMHVGPYVQWRDDDRTGWVVPVPFVASWENEKGGRTTWVTPLIHMATDRDGTIDSAHFVIPMFKIGEMWTVPPLFFATSDRLILPPILSWSGPSKSGGRSTWVAPFFHLETDAKGEMRGFHVGPYFQTPYSWGVFPFVARWENDLDGHSTWVLPFYLSTDGAGEVTGWSLAPLAAGWKKRQGGSTTWITPLFHRSTGRDGGVDSMHVATFVLWDDDKWLFVPLAGGDEDGFWSLLGARRRNDLGGWSTYFGTFASVTDEEGRMRTLVAAPLFASWRDENGFRGFASPLAHLNTDGEGNVRTAHLLNFVVLGPNWFFLPVAAGWAEAAGGRSTWITPLVHTRKDAEGEVREWHVGPYFQSQSHGYWILPPVGGSWANLSGGRTTWLTPLFHVSTDDEEEIDSLHVGPYVQGDGYWFVLPFIAGGWEREVWGGYTHWVTPLFHVSLDEEGGVESLHAGPFAMWKRLEGGRSTWVVPLFHRTTDADGETEGLHVGPYFQWPGGWVVAPPLVGSWAREEGGRTTWATPLFHLTTDADGDLDGMHALLHYQWQDGFVNPLAWSWKRDNGGRTTWVTPLFHSSTDGDGSITSLHAALHFQWTDGEGTSHALLPGLYYTQGGYDGDRFSLFLGPLVRHEHTGDGLNLTGWRWLHPFLFQTGGEDDYEFNFLWAFPSVSKITRSPSMEWNTTILGPLFFMRDRPDPYPTAFHILGGLFARDVFEATADEPASYQYRILWFIPFGGDTIDVGGRSASARMGMRPVLSGDAGTESRGAAASAGG